MQGVVEEGNCKNCNYPVWFDGREWGHYPVNEDGEGPMCEKAEPPDA